MVNQYSVAEFVALKGEAALPRYITWNGRAFALATWGRTPFYVSITGDMIITYTRPQMAESVSYRGRSDAPASVRVYASALDAITSL